MDSGIYEIVNTTNGKKYIGSAVSFYDRFHAHRCLLRKGAHHSRHLQSAWDKHGADAFSFKPLLLCAASDLLLYEQRAIDALQPEYNICRVAGSALGVKWSAGARARKSAQQRANPHFLGRKHAPETLQKMSEAKRGNTAMRGKKRSPEAVAKTVAGHRGLKRSPDTRARIGAAMRASWERRKQELSQ